MTTVRALLGGILVAAAVSSCSSSNDAGVKGTVFGSAIVELFPTDQYATFTAQFFDAPTPPPQYATEVKQQQGGCELRAPVVCDPTCATGMYCSNSKQCVTKPSPIGVGTIHVEGLSGMSLALDPTPPMNNYSGPTLQPFPPCTEGADVSMQSDKITTAIKCTTALVVTSQIPIPVTSGQPMHVTWTPPAMPNISRIELELGISHHGGYKGEIDCDVPDTGSFDIPAPLITGLVSLGRAGFPSIKVLRVSAKSPSGEPGARLAMQSLVEVAVDTGVQSCGTLDAPPCPTGKTCDDNLKICQ
jgi:hypothetical protein